MMRGLLWLPLLAVFIWLAWAGWNEYQKLEAYKVWAAQFDHAKYDIYAVLGHKGDELTWGKPARQAPVNLRTFSLTQVTDIQLRVGNQLMALTPSANAEMLPTSNRRAALEFQVADSTAPIVVPFTDVTLATQWGNHLQRWQQRLTES